MNNNYLIQTSIEINNSENYYIVFNINDTLYAINIKNIVEVINIPEIEIPEKTPKGIIGMFNYNGAMIKVVDICPLLGFKTPQFSINNQIIIANVSGECFAIYSEKIENITQFELNNIQKLPYDTDCSILQEVYKSDKNSVNIINIEILNKILSENKKITSEINYKQLFPSDEKSKQILQIRANQQKITQDVFSFPVNLKTMNQYILFTLDNQNYYLDLKYVKEFVSIRRLNITKLPYTQDFIKGLINVKGEFLIVINLQLFLNNNSTTSTEGTKLIIAEGKNYNLAFLVDDIKYIRNLKNIPSSQLNNEKGYISSEFMEEGKLYSILNFEKIINDDRLYINID